MKHLLKMIMAAKDKDTIGNVCAKRGFNSSLIGYVVTGNTYVMRNKLPGLGCKYNGDLKLWISPTELADYNTYEVKLSDIFNVDEENDVVYLYDINETNLNNIRQTIKKIPCNKNNGIDNNIETPNDDMEDNKYPYFVLKKGFNNDGYAYAVLEDTRKDKSLQIKLKGLQGRWCPELNCWLIPQDTDECKTLQITVEEMFDKNGNGFYKLNDTLTNDLKNKIANLIEINQTPNVQEKRLVPNAPKLAQGDRVNIKVTCISKREVANKFSPQAFVSMKDEFGRCFVWKTKANGKKVQQIRINTSFMLDAMISEVKVTNGETQYMILRPKFDFAEMEEFDNNPEENVIENAEEPLFNAGEQLNSIHLKCFMKNEFKTDTFVFKFTDDNDNIFVWFGNGQYNKLANMIDKNDDFVFNVTIKEAKLYQGHYEYVINKLFIKDLFALDDMIVRWRKRNVHKIQKPKPIIDDTTDTSVSNSNINNDSSSAKPSRHLKNAKPLTIYFSDLPDIKDEIGAKYILPEGYDVAERTGPLVVLFLDDGKVELLYSRGFHSHRQLMNDWMEKQAKKRHEKGWYRMGENTMMNFYGVHTFAFGSYCRDCVILFLNFNCSNSDVGDYLLQQKKLPLNRIYVDLIGSGKTCKRIK